MASSAGNPNQPHPFDVQKLFKSPPASTNPTNPNPNTTPFSLPANPTPPPPSFYPPQSSAPFLHQHQFHQHHAFLHYAQDPLTRPLSPYPPHPPTFPPSPAPNAPPGPSHGAHLMTLLGGTSTADGGPIPSTLESAVSMPPPSLPSGSSGEYGGAGAVPILPTAPSAPPTVMVSAPVRTPSSKLPKGRRLSTGDRAVYDVDARRVGESQPPQLEVTPITKYVSDPGLVLGRQIAVNKNYICYGLKLGAIRVLNINTALRSLLRGHYQRVSDMAFFAEDVHLLASASVDGRIFVWKINEGPDESDKPQITGKIVIALQIVSKEESLHPRVCWHCHKQEVLVIGIGCNVVKIDTSKVGRGGSFSADEPLKCAVEKLVDGVQLVGKHDAAVTDLSMSQWMTTRLVSSSKDGTIKIWEDRKAVPLVTLRPHDGHPVDSVTFLRAPHRPDHIVLITAGSLNRELKIWTSAGQEGWLLPSDSEAWVCTQTLELKNCCEPRVEDAFFNQVVVLPQASLILLANAKKNAIYAVHVDYGPNPASTQMDYIAEFTVTMPILSLTGTSEYHSETEQVVQVYCVQTQAIQQYALDLFQCLPTPLDSGSLENDPSISHVPQTPITISDGLTISEYGPTTSSNDMLAGSALFKSNAPVSSSENTATSRHTAVLGTVEDLAGTNMENKVLFPLSISSADVDSLSSHPALSGPDVPGRFSDFRSSSKDSEEGHSLNVTSSDTLVADRSNYRKIQNVESIYVDDNFATEVSKTDSDDISIVQNFTGLFMPLNNGMHLVTPSEIKSGVAMPYESPLVTDDDIAKAVQDVKANKDFENVETEVKVVGESRLRHDGSDSQKEMKILMAKKKEIASNLESEESNSEITKEYSALTEDIYNVEETRLSEDVGVVETGGQHAFAGEGEVQGMPKDVLENIADAAKVTIFMQSPPEKGNKQKAKESQPSGPCRPSSSFASPFNSTDSLNEQESGPAVLLSETTPSQFMAIQGTLNEVLQQKSEYNEVISMLKEMQKQLSVCAAIPKETRRLEVSLGRNMEKSNKANADAIVAHFQEDNAKLEKNIVQQIPNLMTNSISKELCSMFERTLKKELASVGQAVARAVIPVMEKCFSLAIADSLQSTGSKLEKSVSTKLEGTVARQIQGQFQTSGKQALQETLRSTVESLVIPAFEQSCKAMFDQVDVTFQKGMSEYTVAFQKQSEFSHTPLALALKDAMSSVSSITQSFNTELSEGLQKLLSLASGSQNISNSVALQQSNDRLCGLQRVDTPTDPTKELTRLISDRKFEEAFTLALQRSDVSIVSWLCSQVDLQSICSLTPPPLSQGVLLSLIQQIACDINKETIRKVGWITEVAGVINPSDPTIALHVRPIFEQIYRIMAHQKSLPMTPAESSSIRLLSHVINSVLSSCK